MAPAVAPVKSKTVVSSRAVDVAKLLVFSARGTIENSRQRRSSPKLLLAVGQFALFVSNAESLVGAAHISTDAGSNAMLTDVAST